MSFFYVKLFVVISLLSSANLVPLQAHHLVKLNQAKMTPALIATADGSQKVEIKLIESDPSATLSLQKNTDGSFTLGFGEMKETVDLSLVEGSYQLTGEQHSTVSKAVNSMLRNGTGKQMTALMETKGITAVAIVFIVMLFVFLIVWVSVTAGQLNGAATEFSSTLSSLLTSIQGLFPSTAFVEKKAESTYNFISGSSEGAFKFEEAKRALSFLGSTAEAESWSLHTEGDNMITIKSANGWKVSCASLIENSSSENMSIKCTDAGASFLQGQALEINLKNPVSKK